jgi:molybdopterin synthase catalytic subunit/molybdopterin synthase sulfur carrier subunit
MRVQLRLFAVAKQMAGRDSIELELPEGATIAELRRELGARVPELSGLTPQMMFAVDAEYADDDRTIDPDADLACIPPVSGG